MGKVGKEYQRSSMGKEYHCLGKARSGSLRSVARSCDVCKLDRSDCYAFYILSSEIVSFVFLSVVRIRKRETEGLASLGW